MPPAGTTGLLKTTHSAYELQCWQAEQGAGVLSRRNHFDSFVPEITDFLQAVDDDRSPDLGIDQACVALEMCFCWFESSQKKMPVALSG